MWSIEEFEILLDNPHLTNEELSIQLPRRSAGAINAVRSFIHSFHEGGNDSGLSEMMRGRLEERQGTITCPKCNVIF
jgi:hypothetical protein